MTLLQYEIFKGQKNVVHGISNASHGNMSLASAKTPEEKAVIRNRRQQFWLGIGVTDTARMLIPRPIHGCQMVNGCDWPFYEPPAADIVISDVPGLSISIMSADCEVGAIKAINSDVIALFHAGLAGAGLRVANLTIAYLEHSYNCDPKKLLVALSPSISKQSYIYDCYPESKLYGNPDWKRFIEPLPNENYAIDVRGLVVKQLMEAGIKPEHLECSTVDTFTDPDYFSNSRLSKQKLPQQRFCTTIGLR